MAAPVVLNPSCLELTETAIKKDNFGDWVHYHYTKNSFCRAKQILKMQRLHWISNLLLGEKTVRPAEGGTPNSLGKMGGNQWDALRASHLVASSKPKSLILECLYDSARTYFIKNSWTWERLRAPPLAGLRLKQNFSLHFLFCARRTFNS